MPRDAQGHGSSPRITARQAALIDALFASPANSIGEAAKAAGIPDRTARYAISRPHVRAEIERRIREQLSGQSFVRATKVMHDLLGAESEYVRADIAKHVLSINGVKPATDVAVGAGGGIVFRIVKRNADGTSDELTVGAGEVQRSIGAASVQRLGDNAQLIGSSSGSPVGHVLDEGAGGGSGRPGVGSRDGKAGPGGSEIERRPPAAGSPSHDRPEGADIWDFSAAGVRK